MTPPTPFKTSTTHEPSATIQLEAPQQVTSDTLREMVRDCIRPPMYSLDGQSIPPPPPALPYERLVSFLKRKLESGDLSIQTLDGVLTSLEEEARDSLLSGPTVATQSIIRSWRATTASEKIASLRGATELYRQRAAREALYERSPDEDLDFQVLTLPSMAAVQREDVRFEESMREWVSLRTERGNAPLININEQTIAPGSLAEEVERRAIQLIFSAESLDEKVSHMPAHESEHYTRWANRIYQDCATTLVGLPLSQITWALRTAVGEIYEMSVRTPAASTSVPVPVESTIASINGQRSLFENVALGLNITSLTLSVPLALMGNPLSMAAVAWVVGTNLAIRYAQKKIASNEQVKDSVGPGSEDNE